MDKEFRKQKIQARNEIVCSEREKSSKEISKKILTSRQFQMSTTIMLYQATKGEVVLTYLEDEARKMGKRLVYPLCVNGHEMISLCPKDRNAFQIGAYGIKEPILKTSIQVHPEEIDFIICPCTAFDEHANRIGMGAGYYDRFLPKCTNAYITAAAFEVQKVEYIQRKPWDVPMNVIFTEKGEYYEICNSESKSGFCNGGRRADS